MGGGLMQLVAYGAQDIYLTGNPQITFFKVVYRRHTNFSIEAIQQTFEGSSSSLKEGGNRTCLISRNGDLVYRMWLECDLKFNNFNTNSTYLNWTNNTGHALIEECDIEIGGQRMDKHTSQWMDIWNELTDHDEKEWLGLNKHSAKNAYLKSKTKDSLSETRLYIPLKFWFSRNVGLALPLIALQYHEVKLNIKFRSIQSLLNADISGLINITNSTSSVNLFVDYIYLDTDERRRFAQVSHEYLIEQLQYKKFNSNKLLKLDFNHPIKELIWVMSNKTRSQAVSSNSQSIDATQVIDDGTNSVYNDYFNYSNISLEGSSLLFKETICNQDSYEGFNNATIKLNGHTRFKNRKASYFRLCQPEQAGHKIPTKHIYLYSFALNPEEHQPSGTCNFSRLDNAHLSFENINDDNNKYFINVYAISYNVLRIMSGMGGLAYSN